MNLVLLPNGMTIDINVDYYYVVNKFIWSKLSISFSKKIEPLYFNDMWSYK